MESLHGPPTSALCVAVKMCGCKPSTQAPGEEPGYEARYKLDLNYLLSMLTLPILVLCVQVLV